MSNNESINLERLIQEREVLKQSRPTVINVDENVFRNHKRAVLSLVQCSIATDMWGEDAFTYFAKALDAELRILEAKNPKFNKSHAEVITDRRKNRIHVTHMWKFRTQIIGALQSVLTDMTGKDDNKVFTKKTVKINMDFTGINVDESSFSGAIVFSESGNLRSAGRGALFVRHFYTCNRPKNLVGIRTSNISKELKSLNESMNITWDKNINVLFYSIRSYVDKTVTGEGGVSEPASVSVVDAIIWSASMAGNIRQPIVKDGLLIQRHDEPLNIALEVFKNVSVDWLQSISDRRSGENLYDQLQGDFYNISSVLYYEANPQEFTEELREALLYKMPTKRGYDTSSSIGEILKGKSPESETEIEDTTSPETEPVEDKIVEDVASDDEDDFEVETSDED